MNENFNKEVGSMDLNPEVKGSIDSNPVVAPDVETLHSQLPGSTGLNPMVIPAVETLNSQLQVDDDLVGVMANSEKEAFDIYNEYAFKVGFSVRKSKQRLRVDKSISMKRYLCSRAGSKNTKPSYEKSYSKLDVRSDCSALVQYDVDKEGVWVISKHVKHHNHDLCPAFSSSLLRSHRKVPKIQIAYLRELNKSVEEVADSVKVLNNQSGSSSFVGSGIQETYNALGNSKVLDGTDSNALLQIFRNRQSNETDFFYDFEFDNESRLCNFFWRDGRMKRDYLAFGDLLVHESTYRTNKYNMICGPFVGLNHHGNNVMFGCGLLLNANVESFEWLFLTFLRSMDQKHPNTIMTDQSASMSAAISKIFPESRHRLSIFHIGEDSKKHIRSLRDQKDFMHLFNYVLKDADTVAEFERYWDLITTRYQCKTNKWMVKLYELKEKWCPAFSKNWFSGGILSSQVSKSTKHSIFRRLSDTSGLCDFYHCFVSVISEWRSKENSEDVRCIQGKPNMALSDASLLLHARDVYTIMVYPMFEKEFLKGIQCHQSLVCVDAGLMKYQVWMDGNDMVKHEVGFSMTDKCISCTCKLFEEVGILCCHCLRILNINCVSTIPEAYILKRWRKDVAIQRIWEHDLGVMNCPPSNSTESSLWKIQMYRKFYKLILACEENATARRMCEEFLESLRLSITNVVGPIYFDDAVEVNSSPIEVNSSSSNIIQNPQSTTCDRRLKRKRDVTVEIQTKINFQNMQGDEDLYDGHPTSGSGTLT